MEEAPYQDYYCNSHNVNTPVCECKYIFTNTWTDLFWGKKSCREVRREKKYPAEHRESKKYPAQQVSRKKNSCWTKNNQPVSSLGTADVFPVVTSLPPKSYFSEGERRRPDIRPYVCCSQQATPASKVKWSAAKGRTIRKVMRGGGEFSSRRNFFSLSNSLYEFFSGPCMNIS